MTNELHPLDPRWRVLRWGAAAALLSVPAIAMRFTDEVQWTLSDFLVMGALFAAILLAYEAFARRADTLAYRAGAAAATAGLFGLVWVNLAVGIIGTERNDANMLFALPIATVVGGAIAVRMRAAGLARVLLLAAGETAAIGVAGAAFRLGAEDPTFPADTLGASGLFVAIWLVAAALFARAARA